MANLLAVDLGGTKSRLGLCDLENGTETFSIQEVYRNSEYAGIIDVIADFFEERSISADYLAIAVAGVVEEDGVVMTNLHWHVSERMLVDRFGFKGVVIVNDLAAMAAAIRYLTEDDVVEIKSGTSMTGQAIGVIAPGTGLGQGYLIPTPDNSYIVGGSEGGHTGFAPSDEEELRLAFWLMKRQGWISAEQVCSGPALSTLYRFYSEEEGLEPADWVAEAASNIDDLPSVIVRGAVADEPCLLCSTVISRYLALLGAETANLALKLFARGGMYIGGGVILHLVGKVSLQPFVSAFQGKGKMSGLLATIPVSIILKKDAQLFGALHLALDRLELGKQPS